MGFCLLWGKQIASGSASGKPRPIATTMECPRSLEVKQLARCVKTGAGTGRN